MICYLQFFINWEFILIQKFKIYLFKYFQYFLLAVLYSINWFFYYEFIIFISLNLPIFLDFLYINSNDFHSLASLFICLTKFVQDVLFFFSYFAKMFFSIVFHCQHLLSYISKKLFKLQPPLCLANSFFPFLSLFHYVGCVIKFY